FGERARASSATSTRISVSGRGMNTPGRTVTTRRRNPCSPVRCCSGAPVHRRHSARPYARAWAVLSPSARVDSVARATPSTRIISSSALSRGEPTPWRSRYSAPRRTTSAGRIRPSPRVVGELRRALGGEEPVGEAVQLLAATEHVLQLVRRVPDPMVGHPTIREVVGPDLLRALTRPQL